MIDATAQNYTFTGGLRSGIWNYTYPSCTLEIDQSCLILRVNIDVPTLKVKKEYKFLKEEITKLEIVNGFLFFSRGVRINHTNDSYDKKIIFWYWRFGFNDIVDALKKFGWIN